MKKHLADMTDRELEYAVGRAVGMDVNEYLENKSARDSMGAPTAWCPLTDMNQSMPIIEKLKPTLRFYSGEWEARVVIRKVQYPHRFINSIFDERAINCTGPTIQHAGLRLALAVVHGVEFDLPELLT